MAVLIARALVFIAFCEYIALTFVLITDMTQLQSKKAYLHHWVIADAVSNSRPGISTR
jgi:hypothetical protein